MELDRIETQWSDERIVDIVRKLRNDLIKDFLDERNLKEYVRQQFNISTLSHIKIEFIRKDLKELLIAPVNLQHYQAIIQQIKETDSAALTEHNERLFYIELEGIFKRHLYVD